MTTVGAFDSGIGGKSVTYAIEKSLPDLQVIYVNDQAHVPYGDKTPEQLLSFMVPILQSLVTKGCEIIVIACNTATTTVIEQLREQLSVPLIGIEPMLKPAAQQTKTGVIAVCATPATLGSPRYAYLKDAYAQDIRVIEPDCYDWAYMIEQGQVNSQKIRERIEAVLAEHADVIVLGCTHYHLIETEIKQIVDGRAQVIQPEQAIISRLKTLLNKS